MDNFTRGMGSGFLNSNGMRNLFGSFANAPAQAETARQQAALRGAQTAKYGTEAARGQFFNDRLGDVFNEYKTGVDKDGNPITPERKTLIENMMLGRADASPETIAKMRMENQNYDVRSRALSNGISEQEMGRFGMATAAGEGKPLYSSIGNSGRTLNPYTGSGATSNPDLASGYDKYQAAQTNAQNASAASSYASAARPRGGGRGGSQEQMPVQALKLQNDALEAIGSSASLAADLAAIDQQIASGKLDLGIMSNWINRGRNAAGLSNEQSQNLASLEANLERLRNESLRLNAGVQTDTDAVRAWNELVKDLNDPVVVRKRLREIININRRAAELKKNSINVMRSNYGLPPINTSGFENARASVVDGSAGPQRTANDVYGSYSNPQPEVPAGNDYLESRLNAYR